jgi:FAD:protein FMN transferase
MHKTEQLYAVQRQKCFFALGTYNSITAFACTEEAALERAAERVFELDRKLSAFLAGSEISMLCRRAGGRAQKISPDTFYVLKRAVEIAKASAGAFDITLRPLIALWGIGKKGDFVPDKAQIHRLLKLVDYNDIVLDEQNCAAALRRPGQALDLGGIAKGYAADEVKRILLSAGIESALINLGGNIVAMGTRPDGQPWRIGVQNPRAARGEFFAKLAVQDKTIVTSAYNERFFMKDGVLFHHILDPKTGMPAKSGLLSVTAVCKHSIDADALTTAFFVLGPEKGAPLLQAFDATAVFITDKNQIFTAGNLAGIYNEGASI